MINSYIFQSCISLVALLWLNACGSKIHNHDQEERIAAPIGRLDAYADEPEEQTPTSETTYNATDFGCDIAAKTPKLGKIDSKLRITTVSKNSQLSEKVQKELKFLVELITNTDLNSKKIKDAYEEIKIECKNCSELMDGSWYKKSKNFLKGLESAELLGVASSEFSNYTNDRATIISIINRIRNFEDLCSEMLVSLNKNTITKEESKDLLKELAQYFESIYLLKTLLQTTKVNSKGVEYSRYVIEEGKQKKKLN